MPGEDQIKQAQKKLMERQDIKEWEERMLKNCIKYPDPFKQWQWQNKVDDQEIEC